MGLFKKKSAPEPEVVDLRTPEPAAPAPPTPGAPTPCPECSGPGYVDHIDLKTHSQREHCKACGASWEWEWEETPPVDLSDQGIEIPGLP